MSQDAVLHYFYKNDHCTAPDSDDPACICWHPEGEGPLRAHKHNHRMSLTWKERPALNGHDRNSRVCTLCGSTEHKTADCPMRPA